jgi:hypothetical protein
MNGKIHANNFNLKFFFTYNNIKYQNMTSWKSIEESYIKCWMILCAFLCVCGTRAWTHGLHLESLHQPFFCDGFFQDRVPGLALNFDPPNLCLISGVSYQCSPFYVFWKGDPEVSFFIWSHNLYTWCIFPCISKQ